MTTSTQRQPGGASSSGSSVRSSVATRSTRRAAIVALSVAAAPLLVLGGTTSASAATSPARSVVGSYTLYQRLASSGGQVNTATLTLNADHTCSGTGPGCTWKRSGTTFEFDSPNPRRGGNMYKGTVTNYGLNNPTHTGGVYFGDTGSTLEGDWWAKKL